MLQEPSNSRWGRMPRNRVSIDNSGPDIQAGCIPAAAAVVVPRKQAARCSRYHRCRPCRTRRSDRCPDTPQQARAVDALASGWLRVAVPVRPAPALPAARWTTPDWLARDLNSVVAPPSDPHSVVAPQFDPYFAVAPRFDLYFAAAQPIRSHSSDNLLLRDRRPSPQLKTTQGFSSLMLPFLYLHCSQDCALPA
jgi:hypothetical protein